MQKILLTAIIKDDSELPQFKRMLESFMPYMSGLVVGITGLSQPEGTKEVARLVREHKGEYVLISPETHPQVYLKDTEDKWYFANFAEARNAVFAKAKEMQVEGKYDWWSWADCDDVLVSGKDLEDVAVQAAAQKADWVYFPYWYSVRQDEQGKILGIQVEHMRERLLRPQVPWHWRSRLHEVCLCADDNYRPATIAVEYNKAEGGTKIVWCHLPPEGHYLPNLKRNVQILEEQVKEENHKDPRTIFYLAKCYIDIANQDKKPELNQMALMLLKEYLEMSGWPEERSFACQYMAMIYANQGNKDLALEWYQKAISEHPISHLPYFWMASLYADKGMTEESNHWLDVAMHLPPPVARTTIGSPEEIMLLASKLNYNKAIREQDIPTTMEWRSRWNKIENRKDEEDDILQKLSEVKEANDAAVWLNNYAVFLKKNNHTTQLKYLMSAISPDFKNEQFVQKLIREVMPPKVWSTKSIVYICASTFAPFNPKTALLEGVGGSETAVIRLSEEWVKKGYTVTVYANVTEDAEVNGVDYRHWSQVNMKDTFDTVIIWRHAALLDQPIQARRIIFDAHDVLNQVEWTPERVSKVDKIMVKSQYHRRMIPQIPDNKVRVISNGI